MTNLFIRPATPEDARKIAEVHVRGWQQAYATGRTRFDHRLSGRRYVAHIWRRISSSFWRRPREGLLADCDVVFNGR